MNRTKRTSERMFSFFVGRRDIRTATGALRPGNDTVNKKRRIRRDTWVPPYNRRFCRAGPACPAGAVGRATARVAPTQKFILGRHTQKFLLTPGGKSDTLNAIQAMMGVAARSCGRKCPPDGTVMAVECGVFRIQVEPRTMILVRPELRRQFRAFFY